MGLETGCELLSFFFLTEGWFSGELFSGLKFKYENNYSCKYVPDFTVLFMIVQCFNSSVLWIRGLPFIIMYVLLVNELLDGLSVEAAVYMLVERRQTDIVQCHVAQGTNHLGFLVVYTSRGSLKAIKCNIIITAGKRGLGQGNIFTGVCPPRGGACLPLGSRGMSASGSLGPHPPGTHSLHTHRPHGQQADGTHPTGMLSCLGRYISFRIIIF